MSNEDLRAYLESIDRKLEALAGKIDDMQALMVSKGYCADCSQRWMPKRYVGGFAAFGVVIGLLAALAGDIWGIIDALGRITK